MARLPEVGKDSGIWGSILNDYLSQAHAADGSLKDDSIAEAKLSSDVQTKLNQVAPTWTTLVGKPTVVAAGADDAAARSAIGATSLSVDGTHADSYDLDTTPLTAGDVDAYTTSEVDNLIAAASSNPTPTITSLKDTNGNTILATGPTASAINTISINNAPAGGSPGISAISTGSTPDANVGINLVTKGSGTVFIAVPSGQTPTIKGVGGDANHNLNLQSKGTGVVQANGSTILVNGGALGTPSSGTLTNATGLPVSGIVSSTATALGVGSLEVGHATDATLSRSSAGVLAVENIPLATRNDLKIIAPSSYVSGNYYLCNSPSGSSTNGALGNGTLRLGGWLVTTPVTITRLFTDFTVAGEANSVFRIGIFADDGSGRAGALVLDAGTISTGTGNAGTVATGGTPGVYELTVSITLQPGLYWVGGAVQGAPTTQPTMRTVSNPLSPGGPMGTTLPAAGGSHGGYIATGVTGALASLSAPGFSGSAPRIGFKVA